MIIQGEQINSSAGIVHEEEIVVKEDGAILEDS